MRKTASIICAALLSLSLAACGKSAPAPEPTDSTSTEQTTETEATAEGTTTEEAPAPEPTIVGTWKLAGVEMQSMTLVGDLSSMIDTEESLELTVNENGTGNGVFFGEEEATNFSWEKAEDGSYAISIEGAEDAEMGSLTGTLEDGVFAVRGEVEETTFGLLYSEDGTLANWPAYDASKATPVTSADQVVGSWNMTAVTYEGTTMYGDISQFMNMILEDEDMELTSVVTFNDDGTFDLFGAGQGTWEVGEDGATLGENQSSENSVSFIGKLLMADDCLIIDASEFMGTDMVYILEK